MKEAPKGKVFTVWAVSADNQFAKIGQIVNVKDRNEAEVKGAVTFPDFGLLVTLEDLGNIVTPVGPRVAWVEIIRTN